MIPGLKYPANPPGFGDPQTVNSRTVAFLTLMVMGIVLLMLAWNGATALAARGVDEHRAAVVGLVAFIVGVSIVWVAWTDAESVPADIPVDLLWRFRLRSLGGLALQWLLLGLIFGLAITSGFGRRRVPLAP